MKMPLKGVLSVYSNSENAIARLRENLRASGLRDEFEQANKFRRE